MVQKKTGFARYLRRNQTAVETLLWDCLRSRRCGGYKFRRQAAKDKYIVDFVCESRRIIVEIDGLSHEETADYDANRTKVLETMGYQVIRFSNNDCFEDINETVEAIWQALENAANH